MAQHSLCGLGQPLFPHLYMHLMQYHSSRSRELREELLCQVEGVSQAQGPRWVRHLTPTQPCTFPSLPREKLKLPS